MPKFIWCTIPTHTYVVVFELHPPSIIPFVPGILICTISSFIRWYLVLEYRKTLFCRRIITLTWVYSCFTTYLMVAWKGVVPPTAILSHSSIRCVLACAALSTDSAVKQQIFSLHLVMFVLSFKCNLQG